MEALAAGATTLELVRIPPGEFRMGSGNDFFSETPAHPVRIGSAFHLGKYPVTREQWRAVMGDDPSDRPGEPDRPVDGVSWDHAREFCRRLTELSGRRVRLPSEAEWEYACRAGTAGEFFFGPWGPCADDNEVPWAAREALAGYAWFDRNSGGGTRPVGRLRPNPWGLHDLLGNVWEWCEDVWHDDYTAAPADGSAWAADADRQPRRCLRGGAWDMNAFRCRSPYRSFDHRDLGTSRFGLRVAVTPEPDEGGPMADTPDRHDLQRFVDAQADDYERALAEVRAGRKQTHWMWYVFPQYDGLGVSSTAKRYAIKSRAEAEAYLRHPLLGPRLVECCEAAVGVQGRTAAEVFGSPDDMKLRSSATLFAAVSPAGSVFERVLARYFGGEPDETTLRLLGHGPAGADSETGR